MGVILATLIKYYDDFNIITTLSSTEPYRRSRSNFIFNFLKTLLFCLDFWPLATSRVPGVCREVPDHLEGVEEGGLPRGVQFDHVGHRFQSIKVGSPENHHPPQIEWQAPLVQV